MSPSNDKPVSCIRCSGGGLLHPDHPKPGVLLEVCPACMGAGHLGDQGPMPPFRAAWLVGTRFIVRLTVRMPLSDINELDTDWHPFYPPQTGKRKLKPSEQRDHNAGIAAALYQLKAITGQSGDFSVLTASERH